MAPAFALGFKGLFAIPAMSGLGDHWNLEDQQAITLGEQLDAAVKGLPARKAERLFKIADTWFPWIAFGATMIAVTVPRVKDTREMLHARRIEGARRARESRPEETGRVVGSISTDGATVAAAPGSDGGDVRSDAPDGHEGERSSTRDAIDGSVTPL